MLRNFFKTAAVVAIMAGAGVAYAAEPMADEAITQQMMEAGMTDVVVSHADDKITVGGTLEGKGVELVYDAKTGALQSFDGNSPDVDAHVAFLNIGQAPDAASGNN